MRLLHKLKGMIMKGLSKTKLKMIDALTELCRTKPFDQITIKDICEKADISRNTFYYNYKKKDDILFEAFNVMYQNVFGERTIDERYLLLVIIEEEDKGKPLSDQKIVELMKADGIDVSRRTIAKYRDILAIPSSSKRKRFD